MGPSHVKAILESTRTVALASLRRAGPQIYAYAQENPKRTAFAGASLIALPFGGTAAIAGPVLKCVGFGSAGPIGGKCISQVYRWACLVSIGSLRDILQVAWRLGIKLRSWALTFLLGVCSPLYRLGG